jgi:S-formylglutathione hydrolase FrmB
MRHYPARRAVLAGGAGLAAIAAAGGCYALVENGVLPGKYQLAQLTGACGSAPPPPAGPLPVRHQKVFWSAYRKRMVRMVTLLPPGPRPVRGLRLIIALHGLGGSAASMASQVAPAMATAKISTCAVVTVDGGGTYWHQHADGDNPLGMVIYEVLPMAAAAYGLVTTRIGITGESMGGYGALLLAERLSTARSAGARSAGLAPANGPNRQQSIPAPAAVSAISPALFASYADARAADRTSFDDVAEFANNDVQTGVAALRRVPTWISCGSDDPFQPQAMLLRGRLARLTGRPPAGGILPGCHDDAFFERSMPAALTFAARHLGTG